MSLPVLVPGDGLSGLAAAAALTAAGISVQVVEARPRIGPKAEAAVCFAHKVAVARGAVTEDDLRAVRMAGYSDAQMIEIVLHVALNVLTNDVNEVFATKVDFPVVAAQRAA